MSKIYCFLKMLLFVICVPIIGFPGSFKIDPTFKLLHPHYDQRNIKILTSFVHRKNRISFVCDNKNNIFLIKQALNRILPELHLISVKEAFGAYMAQLHNVPANHVEIIPAGRLFPGKMCVDMPASIHTVVPGKPVKISLKNSIGNIRQRRGLNYQVIKGMGFHSDLPSIIAIDTFIANIDRASSNFFYDKKTNSFFAIDFGDIFMKNVAALSCNFMQKILKNKSVFLNEQELCGLWLYRNMLKKLIKKHPPDSSCKKLDELVFQAGLGPGSPLHNRDVAREIQSYKKNITESYASSKELVLLLDQVLDYHKVSDKKVKKYFKSGCQLDWHNYSFDSVEDKIQIYKKR